MSRTIRTERARRYERRFRIALGAAIAAHALALWLVRLPTTESAIMRGPLFVSPEPIRLETPPETRRLEQGPDEAERAGAREPDLSPLAREPAPERIATPAPGARAPATETIPRTRLSELHEAVLPLEATPFGARRRPVVRDEARIARMRAESLVNARIASLVEVQPAPSAGPVSLANGGVTLAVPWGGFVRGDRSDEAWREERCKGKEKGKADKAGEGEARRAQCG